MIKRFITKLTVLSTLSFALIFTGCHPIEDFDNNAQGNFEALWTIIDQHYCFLDYKDIDWDQIYQKYAAMITPEMSGTRLFMTLAAMLDELRDGHVNLSSPAQTSYYRKWWSDYPQNFDSRIIEESYFDFNYRQLSAFYYGILPQNIGYFRYPSFSYGIGDGNLDIILNYFSGAAGLIIDVRDNGGGDVSNADKLIARFITQRTLAGYISHKTGPGHSDFSDPEPIFIDTPGGGHLLWRKPVVVLTNRSTFSAANYFTMVMKNLPGVTIVGATTGGGAGMPISYELPNGWGIRFSACPVYDINGELTEFGVEPTEGCAVDMDPLAAFYGHDTMLEFAIQYLIQEAQTHPYSL